jgi:hypothetical protein
LIERYVSKAYPEGSRRGELDAEVDLGGGELEADDVDLDSGEPGAEVEMGGVDLLA